MQKTRSVKSSFTHVLWFVLPLAVAQPATAQSVWRATTGDFSVVIPETWQTVPPGEVDTGSTSTPDLVIRAVQEPTGQAPVGCSIFRLNHSAPADVSQAAANDALQDMDRNRIVADASRVRGSGVKLLDFRNELRDGVRTVSATYVTSARGGATSRVVWQSQFMLALGGSKVAFFTFSCNAPESERGVDVARAVKTFGSLRFGSLAN